jgi:hypothetical protein
MGDTAKEGSALQTAKDLFAGAAGGVAQVLIGMHCTSHLDHHSNLLVL